MLSTIACRLKLQESTPAEVAETGNLFIEAFNQNGIRTAVISQSFADDSCWRADLI